MATYVKKDETLESAMRRFKKEVLKAGIMNDLRKHEFFVAPSLKRRLKSEAARKRAKRKGK
jgi:small subunit ribosomal protein S21